MKMSLEVCYFQIIMTRMHLYLAAMLAKLHMPGNGKEPPANSDGIVPVWAGACLSRFYAVLLVAAIVLIWD